MAGGKNQRLNLLLALWRLSCAAVPVFIFAARSAAEATISGTAMPTQKPTNSLGATHDRVLHVKPCVAVAIRLFRLSRG
jgi:hypothetical protein